jgi:hypothetical protein
MWWHHVEALSDFNILVNYWWRQVPLHMGAPADALQHALLSIKDLPAAQRDVWRQQFFTLCILPPSSGTHTSQSQGDPQSY